MGDPESIQAPESFGDTSGSRSVTDSKGRPVDLESPSEFAPKFPAKFKGSLSADEDVWIDAEEFLLGDVPRDRSPTVQNLRFPRSLDPTTVPEPPPLAQQRPSVRLLTLLGLVSVVAVAFVVMWSRDKPPVGGDEANNSSLVSRLSALVAGDTHDTTASATRLVVTEAPGGLHVDEATALGLAVDGAAGGAQVVIGGITAGSVFSGGRSIGPTAWSLPASQIETATLTPPRGFAGVMDVAVTLMLANGSLSDRKVVRLEWLPDASAFQPPAPRAPAVSRRLDAGELTALVARGNALVATGDLAGARLLYRRAAEAGNARAALTLAETYDPVVLETLGESGLAPNVAMARLWYKKANELGSTEALARLEKLERRTE
jgi:hypothetical protein